MPPILIGWSGEPATALILASPHLFLAASRAILDLSWAESALDLATPPLLCGVSVMICLHACWRTDILLAGWLHCKQHVPACANMLASSRGLFAVRRVEPIARRIGGSKITWRRAKFLVAGPAHHPTPMQPWPIAATASRVIALAIRSITRPPSAQRQPPRSACT